MVTWLRAHRNAQLKVLKWDPCDTTGSPRRTFTIQKSAFPETNGKCSWRQIDGWRGSDFHPTLCIVYLPYTLTGQIYIFNGTKIPLVGVTKFRKFNMFSSNTGE